MGEQLTPFFYHGKNLAAAWLPKNLLGSAWTSSNRTNTGPTRQTQQKPELGWTAGRRYRHLGKEPFSGQNAFKQERVIVPAPELLN